MYLGVLNSQVYYFTLIIYCEFTKKQKRKKKRKKVKLDEQKDYNKFAKKWNSTIC